MVDMNNFYRTWYGGGGGSEIWPDHKSHLTGNGCVYESRRYNEEPLYDKWADLLNDMANSAKKAGASVEKVSKGIASIPIEKEKERDIDMKVYYVKFDGTDKLYAYYCARGINMQVGAKYSITADDVTTYRNAVTLVKIMNTPPVGVKPRTITAAKLVQSAPVPPDQIKNVIFNKKKRTTVVLWADGEKTIIKCCEDDIWDEEKALALCFMKKMFGNQRGFKKIISKYCHKNDEEEVESATAIETAIEEVRRLDD